MATIHKVSSQHTLRPLKSGVSSQDPISVSVILRSCWLFVALRLLALLTAFVSADAFDSATFA
ncbi:hypothetical protein L228DRAFT_248609 [Xylona heveae TC161]|uniref:Uncharacterized protein n=1 Tax=Xylona heveae (strain CBS 132557 / TC161) TaxID=1328760 RepID=A0A165G870_XYLHT|nr:hypothetical protein L228DRAFT_248609 [Xylona heveae TC161]KZF21854.1 hypothetical protein L228DRAFT_248609 [Xylona heveae TC161]